MGEREITIKLPPPDDWLNAVNEEDEDVLAPVWNGALIHTVTAWTEGVEVDDNGPEPVDAVRALAIGLLAACAQVEAWALGSATGANKEGTE